MSSAERKFMKQVDFFILNASKEDLKKIQHLDAQTQLEGISFYDVITTSKPQNTENFFAKPHSEKN